jgi:hypothetical protein
MPDVPSLAKAIDAFDELKYMLVTVTFGRGKSKVKSRAIGGEAWRYIHKYFTISIVLREGGDIVKLATFKLERRLSTTVRQMVHQDATGA